MKKILIIEDDTVLRENTAEFIKGQNFKVFIAEDGLVGVQQTLKHLPDLILCDISMPNMNGYDFYKTIKQIKATSTIPLVFLSAKTENEDIAQELLSYKLHGNVGTTLGNHGINISAEYAHSKEDNLFNFSVSTKFNLTF